VDKDSATLGLPGLREKHIPMDADHVEICKFVSIDGSDYKQVASNLIELANFAVNTAAVKTSKASLSPCKLMLIRHEGVNHDRKTAQRNCEADHRVHVCSCSIGGGPAMFACFTID
jgi:hypothetical protein